MQKKRRNNASKTPMTAMAKAIRMRDEARIAARKHSPKFLRLLDKERNEC